MTSQRTDGVALAPSQDEPAAGTQARRALSDAKRHLQKSALKLLGYLAVVYLVLRLVPTLEQALRSLKHVSGRPTARDEFAATVTAG